MGSARYPDPADLLPISLESQSYWANWGQATNFAAAQWDGYGLRRRKIRSQSPLCALRRLRAAEAGTAILVHESGTNHDEWPTYWCAATC